MRKIKTFLLEIFRENLGIKIGSLILATMIWWFVISQQEAEVSFEVPLKVINIPRGIVLTSKSSSTVAVRIRGLTNALNLLTENQIQPVIVLGSNTKPGNMFYQLRPKDIRIPEGFKIVTINPSMVEIVLEQETVRSLPVYITVKGVPAEGYELGNTVVIPETVKVSGPASILNGLEAIYTETIDITDKSMAWEARANLIAPSNLINFLERKTVDVQIRFKQKIVEITLMSYEYQKVMPSFPAKFTPENLLVTLKGPELKLKKFQGNPGSDLVISVDASNLKPGKHEVKPTVLRTPQDVTVLSIDPEIIQVTIMESPSVPGSTTSRKTKKKTP